MRLLYLTQWFDPEPAALKGASFARALTDAGLEIEVITGFPNYALGRVYPGYRVRVFQREVIKGIVVNRVPLYPSHDRSSFGRALNYLSFFLSSVAYGLARAGRFDAIYAYHPPITVGLAAALVGLASRRPFVLDVQDLWPDSVAASGMTSATRLARLLGPLCRYVYRRAAVIVAQSEGIRAKLIERGVPADKVVTIYNWADEAAVEPNGACDLARYRFAGRFNIVFAGNMGRVQGLDTLVQAAHLAARQSPGIQLLLIGDGVEHDRLAALVRELGATNVNVERAVPKHEIADVLAAADALIVHLANVPLFEVTIPSKIQFYLASGKPVLVAVNGEAAKLVLAAGAGVAAPPGDPAAIADAMVALSRAPEAELLAMGERAEAFYREQFSFSAGVASTIRVLDSLGNATSDSPVAPQPII
jgi:glycosyltransferase involved in cell wall biosynthesis